jgi:hypothetical protein
MINAIWRTGILALAIAALPTVGDAATVPYFGQDAGSGESARLSATPNADDARAAFVAAGEAAGGLASVESFERFDNGSFPYRTPDGRWDPGVKLRFGGGVGEFNGGPTATMVSTRGTVVAQPQGTNGFGRYPTDGDKFFHSSAEQISFGFDRQIRGFGFDGIDIGDFRGELSIDLFEGEKLVRAFTLDQVAGGKGGDVLFWGFFSGQSSFDKVVFGNTNADSDVFAMDGLTVVTPVPAALPLLGSGLAALAWMRRRRSQG